MVFYAPLLFGEAIVVGGLFFFYKIISRASSASSGDFIKIQKFRV
jgi:hypothetical protein